MTDMTTVKRVEIPVTLTAGALAEVRSLLQEKSVPPDHGLRLGVKGGGCAGFSYLLGFDKPGDKDNTYLLEGVLIIIERSHELYLAGMELDFHNGLDNRGFLFNNPNADSTCGCGSSFSA